MSTRRGNASRFQPRPWVSPPRHSPLPFLLLSLSRVRSPWGQWVLQLPCFQVPGSPYRVWTPRAGGPAPFASASWGTWGSLLCAQRLHSPYTSPVSGGEPSQWVSRNHRHESKVNRRWMERVECWFWRKDTVPQEPGYLQHCGSQSLRQEHQRRRGWRSKVNSKSPIERSAWSQADITRKSPGGSSQPLNGPICWGMRSHGSYLWMGMHQWAMDPEYSRSKPCLCSPCHPQIPCGPSPRSPWSLSPAVGEPSASQVPGFASLLSGPEWVCRVPAIHSDQPSSTPTRDSPQS